MTERVVLRTYPLTEEGKKQANKFADSIKGTVDSDNGMYLVLEGTATPKKLSDSNYANQEVGKSEGVTWLRNKAENYQSGKHGIRRKIGGVTV